MDKEKKSFEILVRENSRMLTVFLSTRIREQAVIDDLFQETMLVAWKRLPDYDLDRPFGPWLRGIAYRVTLDYFKKQSRIPFLISESVNDLIDKHFESINLQKGRHVGRKSRSS
jgi:RNA polymerase sigma-70 factor (ECF subfamily)